VIHAYHNKSPEENMRKWFIALFISLLVTKLHSEAHKIEIMMTVPRTISTAFERSMMAREDHRIFHEPWNSEHNYRNHLLAEAPPEEIIQAGSYMGIKALLYKHAEEQPVYVKDMIWAIQDELLGDVALLSDPNVIFSLLIRDPARSIESFFLKISQGASTLAEAVEITRWVFRYDALLFLAEKHREIRGEWPILVEAEELCIMPDAIMRDYCQRAGIQYLSEALVWEKKMAAEWEHTKHWHEDAAESRGFFMPAREAKTRFSSVPAQSVADLEAIYQAQKPYYEQLQKIKTAL